MTVATDSSSLLGEYTSRDSTTGSRSSFTTTFSGLRSGTAIGSSGEVIYTAGMYDSSSGGNLMTAVLMPSVLQTSSFDINVDWQFTVGRQ